MGEVGCVEVELESGIERGQAGNQCAEGSVVLLVEDWDI